MDDKDTKTVTFDMNTDNPRCVVLKIKCEFDLDGTDLEDALKELLKVLKNARARELAGH